MTIGEGIWFRLLWIGLGNRLLLTGFIIIVRKRLMIAPNIFFLLFVLSILYLLFWMVPTHYLLLNLLKFISNHLKFINIFQLLIDWFWISACIWQFLFFGIGNIWLWETIFISKLIFYRLGFFFIRISIILAPAWFIDNGLWGLEPGCWWGFIFGFGYPNSTIGEIVGFMADATRSQLVLILKSFFITAS